MTSREDHAIKNAFDEFLKRACEIAKGDITKSIKIDEIWNDSFPITALNREHYLPIIIKSLKDNQFIQDGNKDNEINTLRQN